MNKSTKPLLLRNFDVNKLKFMKLKKYTKSDLIKFTYNNSYFVVQTPQLLNYFGVEKISDYYSLSVPLFGPSIQKTNEFRKFINEIERLSINHLKNKLKDIVGDKYQFRSILRFPVDEKEKFNDTGFIKFKFNLSNHSIFGPIKFSHERREIKLEELEKGNMMKMIILISGIHLHKKSKIAFINMRPLLIDQRQNFNNISLEDDSDDEDEMCDFDDENMFTEKNDDQQTLKTKNNDTNEKNDVDNSLFVSESINNLKK